MQLLTPTGFAKIQTLLATLHTIHDNYHSQKKYAETLKTLKGYIDIVNVVLLFKDADLDTIKKAVADKTLAEKFYALYKLPTDDEVARELFVALDDAVRSFSLEKDLTPDANNIFAGVLKMTAGTATSPDAAKADLHVSILKMRISLWEKRLPTDWYNGLLLKFQSEFSCLYDAFMNVAEAKNLDEEKLRLAYQQLTTSYIVWANHALDILKRVPYREIYIDKCKALNVASIRKNLLVNLAEIELTLNQRLLKVHCPPFSIVANYLTELSRHQGGVDYVKQLKEHLRLQINFLDEYAKQSFLKGNKGKKKIAAQGVIDLTAKKNIAESKSFNEWSLLGLFKEQYFLRQDHAHYTRTAKIGPGTMGAELDKAWLRTFDVLTEEKQDPTLLAAVQKLLKEGETQLQTLSADRVVTQQETVLRAILAMNTVIYRVLDDLGLSAVSLPVLKYL